MKPRTMKRNSQFQSSLTAACSVLLMLCAGQAGLAQQSATDKPVAAASVAPAAASTAPAAKHPAPQHPAAQTATAEKAATAPAKPGSEGIKVHGHWIIDVKNPDGSLAQHRDFENSLQDGGQFLTGLASGYMVFGGYYIGFVGNACAPTALDGSTNCYISQNGAFLSAQCAYYTCIGGLTVAANITTGSSQPYSIVLSGSGVVPLAGTISAVQTLDFYCYSYNGIGYVPTGANPAACTTTGLNGGPTVGINGGTFTGTTLATPLAVTAGQVLLVTVTISFS
ncbi:MAG: hypothetical protein ABSG56_13860 [Bryobacteraceae bacterium]|jgi:hypothetical protein